MKAISQKAVAHVQTFQLSVCKLHSDFQKVVETIVLFAFCSVYDLFIYLRDHLVYFETFKFSFESCAEQISSHVETVGLSFSVVFRPSKGG